MGNGGYLNDLYPFKLDSSPYCPICDGIPEDPKYGFLTVLDSQRKGVPEETLGRAVAPESLIGEILEFQKNWNAVNYHT